MFSWKSAMELVEKLVNLKVGDTFSVVECDVIKEEVLAKYFHSIKDRTSETIDILPNIPVFDVLGQYDPDKRQITIYTNMIRRVVERVSDDNIDFDTLTDVVLFHEISHLITHIGKDEKGRIWDKFKDASNDDKEIFAQLYPYILFSNFGAFSKHLYTFVELCKYQNKRYNLWIMMKDLTITEINKALSNCRQNRIPFPEFFIEITRSGGIPLVAEVASSYRIHADGSCYILRLNLNKMPLEKPEDAKGNRILKLVTEYPSKIPSEKLIKAKRLLPEIEKYVGSTNKEDFYKLCALFKIMEVLTDFDDGITEKDPYPIKVGPENIRALYDCSLQLLHIPVPRKIFGPLWVMDAVETTITIFWCGKLWGTWTAINDDWNDYKELFDRLIKIINVCLKEAKG